MQLISLFLFYDVDNIADRDIMSSLNFSTNEAIMQCIVYRSLCAERNSWSCSFYGNSTISASLLSTTLLFGDLVLCSSTSTSRLGVGGYWIIQFTDEGEPMPSNASTSFELYVVSKIDKLQNMIPAWSVCVHFIRWR